MAKLRIVFIVLQIGICHAKILPIVPYTNSLSDELVNLLNQNVDNSPDICVLTSDQFDFISFTQSRVTRPQIIGSGTQIKNSLANNLVRSPIHAIYPTKGNSIILTHLMPFNLSPMENLNFWIIFNAPVNEMVVKFLLETMAVTKFPNNMIVLFKTEEGGIVHKWRLNPYNIDLPYWDLTKSTNLMDFIKLVFWDLSKHIIHITVVKNPPHSFMMNNRVSGTDGRMLNLICDKFRTNYTIVKTNTSIYNRFWKKLGVKGASILSVLTEYVDFNINANVLTLDILGLKKSYPRKITNLVVLVPRAKESYTFVDTFRSFDTATVVLFPIMVCMTCIIWYWIKKRDDNKTSVILVLLDIWQISIMGSPSYSANNKFGKLFLIATVWFFFIYSCCFQTLMIVNMINPSYKPDIDTLAELGKRNISVVTNSFFEAMQLGKKQDQLHIHLENTINPIYKFVSSPEYSLCKNYSFLVDEDAANYFLTSEYNRIGRWTIFHKMKETFPQFVTHIISSNVAYTRELEFIWTQIVETSLEMYWKTITNHDMYLAGLDDYPVQTFGNDDDFDVLTFQEFWNIASPIFIIECSIGILVFIGEIIYHKIRSTLSR